MTAIKCFYTRRMMKRKRWRLVCFNSRSSEGPLHGGDLQLRKHLRPVVGRPVGKMHVPPGVRGQSRADGVRQRREGLPQRVRTPPARLQEPEEHPRAVPGPLWWALPFCFSHQQRVDHVCLQLWLLFLRIAQVAAARSSSLWFFPSCVLPHTCTPASAALPSFCFHLCLFSIKVLNFGFLTGRKEQEEQTPSLIIPSLQEIERDGGRIREECGAGCSCSRKLVL